jgi:hypothetical protein
MTDVTVTPNAPAGAPVATPAAPATGPRDVPVNPNPVNVPTPVGPQAPDAPVGEVKGSEHRPQSRREAIQAAFDRANAPQVARDKAAAKPQPKPAEAKPGHNKPPATETEAPAKLDLKKRPVDQEPQPRGERGQFAPRQQAASSGMPGHAQNAQNTQNAQTAAQTAAKGAQTAQPRPQLPANAPFRDPIPRMSERATADWHATPESVRGDMHRITKEFKQAYDYYKNDYETMNTIRDFQQMATEGKTTLRQALTNYVGIENKLRADPVAGLDTIINNLNLVTSDGQKIGLRDIAYHVLTQTPDQLRSIQQGNQQTAAAHQIGALHQEVAGLKSTLQQMHNQQRFTQLRTGVDGFAAQHPRFDELGDLIEAEIKLGFDLDTAYRRAELLRPATHAVQNRTQPAQTRTTDRSISGAPSGGPTNGTGRRNPDKQMGRRETIADAMRRVSGSM